jgi:hypothetical protein
LAGHSGLYVASADIRRVLLESDDDDDSGYINFIEGNDSSDVDFAQEENRNYTDGVVEEVKEDDVAHVLTSYRGQKFPFSGHVGLRKMLRVF